MYKAIDLNYNYNDLEPVLDSETVNIHYNKHYKSALNKLNNLLIKANYDFSNDPIWIIKNIDYFELRDRSDILVYAGSVTNHELYFSILGTDNHTLTGLLKEKIEKQYGSYENFKNDFINIANKLVGSGFTFLVLDSKNDLRIINMPNYDSPYSYQFKPILALDLFEHSYYLKYRNNRSDYINNFFDIVDFAVVNKNYEENIKK